jgi:hypothetical protein
LSGQNTETIRHVYEVTFVGQKWQLVRPGYYIPRTTSPSWSTPIVSYYTLEPVPILSRTAVDLKLEHNQLLTQLEHLCNLDQKPSHRPSSQQLVELVEAITTLVVV